MRKIVVLCASALAMAACGPTHYSYPPVAEAPMAPQPSPRPNPPSLPSYTAPTPPPRTVKPLALGALTAKNVGGYMDNEERDLRADLRGSGVLVSRPGDAITLLMRGDVLFTGRDSTTLSARGSQIIAAIAAVVGKYDSTALTVNGYTDTVGPSDKNMQLSQARADAVGKALAASGIDPHRITSYGFGDTRLKIPTGPGKSEPRNRRVDILITPKMKA
ncbi:MAG TPA: OmpA family protein [Rhizomicrobium sp.]|nr:OmpA family protein [Rhizomicrobium sp.]